MFQRRTISIYQDNKTLIVNLTRTKNLLDAQNTQVIFAKRPGNGPINTDEVFKFVKTPIPKEEDIPQNHVLIKVLYLSLDPGKNLILASIPYKTYKHS
jgi:NADPH-dependent curcumin reductase CurA